MRPFAFCHINAQSIVFSINIGVLFKIIFSSASVDLLTADPRHLFGGFEYDD